MAVSLNTLSTGRLHIFIFNYTLFLCAVKHAAKIRRDMQSCALCGLQSFSARTLLTARFSPLVRAASISSAAILSRERLM